MGTAGDARGALTRAPAVGGSAGGRPAGGRPAGGDASEAMRGCAVIGSRELTLCARRRVRTGCTWVPRTGFVLAVRLLKADRRLHFALKVYLILPC